MSQIPTRLYVGDQDFDPDLGRRLVITVDGVTQSLVIGYDIETGQVTRCKVDEAGNLMVDIEGERIVHEIVRGTVVVVLMPA